MIYLNRMIIRFSLIMKRHQEELNYDRLNFFYKNRFAYIMSNQKNHE